MAEEKKKDDGKIRIQYYRSAIGFPKTQKEVVRSVGFTKLNQIVERPDTGAVRDSVQKVPHLLRIVEGGESSPARQVSPRKVLYPTRTSGIDRKRLREAVDKVIRES